MTNSNSTSTFNRSQILSMAWANIRSAKKKGITLTFGEAQKKAWAANTLKNALRASNEVKFTFTKLDGSERIAYGTLMPEFFNGYSPKGANASNVGVVKYFDVEKNGFRSFNAFQLVNA